MTDDAGSRPRPGMNVAAGDGESPALDQAFDSDSLYSLRAAVAAHGSQAAVRRPHQGPGPGRARTGRQRGAPRRRAGRLRLWAADDAVRCEVTDQGVPGETDAADAADAARWQAEPGHGLWLVRQIADSASVQSGESGTVAAVIFRRGPS